MITELDEADDICMGDAGSPLPPLPPPPSPVPVEVPQLQLPLVPQMPTLVLPPAAELTDPQQIIYAAVASVSPVEDDEESPEDPVSLMTYCVAANVAQVYVIMVKGRTCMDELVRVPGNHAMQCRIVDAVAILAARATNIVLQAKYRAICLMLLGGDRDRVMASYRFARAYNLRGWYMQLITDRCDGRIPEFAADGPHETPASVIPWPPPGQRFVH